MKFRVSLCTTIIVDAMHTVRNRYKVIVLTIKSNGPLLKAVTKVSKLSKTINKINGENDKRCSKFYDAINGEKVFGKPNLPNSLNL